MGTRTASGWIPAAIVMLGFVAHALLGPIAIRRMERVDDGCDDLLRSQGKAFRMTDAWRRAVTGGPG